MPRKRPLEPIAPATIPGEPLDPKIPPEDQPEPEPDEDREQGNERPETEEEQEAHESEPAFDRATTRIPSRRTCWLVASKQTRPTSGGLVTRQSCWWATVAQSYTSRRSSTSLRASSSAGRSAR